MFISSYIHPVISIYHTSYPHYPVLTGYSKCANGRQCVPLSAFCDGKHGHPGCADRSDENPELCKTVSCPQGIDIPERLHMMEHGLLNSITVSIEVYSIIH